MVTLLNNHRVGLALKIGRDHRQKRGEAVLVVGERVAKCRFDRAPPGSDEQVDMRDFVAVSDQRFTDHYFRDLCHANFLQDTDYGVQWTPQPSERSMDSYPCWQRPDCPDRLAR